ncbi:cysteine hydrolase family protein [Picrophilus oshimae]|uniref:Isochorismatase n=1 Tax=Picrophilus torridus (strain ATCC 700027 / DSM 9790 / JCM 10055 / NBRC 100828 / KAW 2/3) TaxID=1122961 RepID=Q6L196_PICTO|nr:isochorismatase family cysteine hydrolase [Picrophilus oshimae]AAT43256.1 isochorismatase [Picrophilus oshimae DSM 9789]SMD30437.1 Nicotinamidase-related amidase [Picrophilus oshimae DSM 9789]
MDVLIVIDMLNDFIHGALKTDEALKTVGPASRVVEIFHNKNLPVIYACDSHNKYDFEMKLWGEHAMKNSWGSKIIDELKLNPGDFIIEKHFYSAFHDTNLDAILNYLNAGRLFLIGLDADICVRHTTADAFYLGYETIIIKDAVAARIDKNWEDYYKRVYGSKIITLNDLEESIKN